jgi:hypothetical protein
MASSWQSRGRLTKGPSSTVPEEAVSKKTLIQKNLKK